MAKNYSWRQASQIISGGYSGEDTGVIPPDTGWRTTSATSGSSTAEYYYRDSEFMDNNRSSRVVVGISESWTASIDNRNNLTVVLTTTITGVRRDNVVGNPGGGYRNLFIRRYDGGPVLWAAYNDYINTAHTILGSPITLETYTFTLAPGEDLSRGSVFFRNNNTGHDSDPTPSIYVDLMWLGTEFKNILPADYIPGKVYDGSGDWLSHNRTTNGHAKIYNGSTFVADMRTVAGGEESGNPPEIWHSSSAKKNMRLIGTGA